MDRGSDQHQHLGSMQPQSTWSQHQLHPHSTHGTPAQEFTGFTWSQPALPIDSTMHMDTTPLHSHLQALQPLAMPQWPSMLNSQASYKVVPLSHHPAIQPLPALPSMPPATPVSASSQNLTTVPRRTLTDEDRRNMCLLHEANPGMKQTEIGSQFGVDRSTVSKVLRQQERYLERDKGGTTVSKRDKAGKPEVERALSAWARKQQLGGRALSDDSIREQAALFSASVGGGDKNPATNSVWLEKFKRRHSSQSLPRKNSLAPDELDMHATPSSSSPRSPESAFLLLSSNFSDAKSQESLCAGRPADMTTSSKSPPQVQPRRASSIPTVSIPAPGSSKKKKQRPLAPATGSSTQRSRSRTLPVLDRYMSPPPSTDAPITKFSSSEMLDSPMNEYPSYIEEQTDALGFGSSDNDSRTISPSDIMRAPLMPAPARPYKTDSPSIEIRLVSALGSPQGAPTQEDAREALEIVIKYFQQQPNGCLDFHENVLLGKLQEKLKF